MRTADNTVILDGSPRYAHKTTQLIERMADTTDFRKLIICHNHQLAHEICTEHLGDNGYGPDEQRRIVHLQGKERACPDCDHNPDGQDHYQIVQAAEEALSQHRVVTPDVFADVCPYYACKEAAKRANWVVTVPQMLDRYLDGVDIDEHQVLIDEESTMKHFLGQGGKLFSFTSADHPLIPGSIEFEDDNFLSTSALHNVRQRLENKIDEYERVPGRYRNVERAYHALTQLHTTLSEEIDITDYDDPETFAEALETYEVPDVDMTSSEREQSAAFTYIRKDLGRYQAAKFLEAALTNGQIKVEKSQNVWNAYLVPDPTHDFLYHRELFENCAELYLVGEMVAGDFANRFMPDDEVADAMESDGRVDTDNLDIIVLSGDEFDRRGAATRISQELTNHGVHNLLIAGSGTRAAQAHDSLYPSSYYFQGQATLDHYQDVAQNDWSVVSYMGSRITRGVDVDTQVTICRSMQFASPMWGVHPDEEYGEEMARYENLIELHNAMLRGAGQGEQHIAVIPEPETLKYGLYRYATSYDITEIDAIVNHIFTSLGIITDDLTCPDCGTRFVTQYGFQDHDCDDTIGTDSGD